MKSLKVYLKGLRFEITELWEELIFFVFFRSSYQTFTF